MKRPPKPIRLTRHAKERLGDRGATEREVHEAIHTTDWQPAELNRLECRKEFPYNAVWSEKMCAIKEVRPIFLEEPSEIVVITVYVYYR